MRVADLYARLSGLGIQWDTQSKRWVYVANNSLLVEGAYSLHDVLVAWQKGTTALKTMYPEHDRALLFATQFEFPTYFGDQASRLVKNGGTVFTAARAITGYDLQSQKFFYVGTPPLYGQVNSAGSCDSSKVDPREWKHIEVHGAHCIKARKGAALQFILIVDAANVPEQITAGTENCMPVYNVLTGKPINYTLPDVKLVEMPTPSHDHEDSLRKLLKSMEVAKLMKLFGEGRFVMKGFQSATSTSNAALDLLLHELNEIDCSYLANVVKSIKDHYAARGVQKDQLSFRYHLNIVGGECITKTSHQSRLKPDHNPHCDAVRTNSNEEEMKTERAVATITINAPLADIDAFKKMIKDSEKEVPGKTGHLDYDFEKTVGKAYM